MPIEVRVERAGQKKVYLSFLREPIFEFAGAEVEEREELSDASRFLLAAKHGGGR
ncbi:MAG: hypothetical protein HYZ73_06605 [Elusimicrobia bacterium]|nr:hypothetical protein [Elusimicrobiota bacterium]